jgi:hypothetical protein
MPRLPARPDIGHLKKQAKDLLAQARGGDPAAWARFDAALPAAARGRSSPGTLRLHDAQSCLAREYGCASWAELGHVVAARRARADDPAAAAAGRAEHATIEHPEGDPPRVGNGRAALRAASQRRGPPPRSASRGAASLPQPPPPVRRRPG